MIEYTVKVYNDRTIWFLNDELHREDGPAIEYTNGDEDYYLNGKYYTEENYHKEIQKRLNPVKELTVAEISEILGYDVKIVK